MDKKIIKFLALLFLTILIISTTQTLFAVGSTNAIFIFPIIMTYIMAFFYLPIINSENKKLKRIYNFVLIGSYFLTFHKIYMVFCSDPYLELFIVIKELIIIFILTSSYFLSLVISKDKDGFSIYHISLISIHVLAIFLAISLCTDDFITIKPGFILYSLSMIPIIITEFLQRKPKTPIEPNPKMVNTPNDISDSYLFANYISGLEGTSKKDDLAVIINKEKKREIIVGTSEPGPNSLHLEYFRIKKFILQKYVIDRDESDDKNREIERERVKILSIILAQLGAEAASDELRQKLDDYDDSIETYGERITIIYEHKKCEKNIELYSKADTSLLIETLEKTLPFPIERI